MPDSVDTDRARVSTGLPKELMEEAEQAESQKRAIEQEAATGRGDDLLSKTLTVSATRRRCPRVPLD